MSWHMKDNLAHPKEFHTYSICITSMEISLLALSLTTIDDLQNHPLSSILEIHSFKVLSKTITLSQLTLYNISKKKHF